VALIVAGIVVASAGRRSKRPAPEPALVTE
jgi:hypothetical protein